jgi:hypothetical protein
LKKSPVSHGNLPYIFLEDRRNQMAIYSKCCNKFFKSSKKKCDICNGRITKYVVKVQDPATRRWRTKTVLSLKLAKEVETKFKTELIEGQLFDRKQTGTIDFSKYLAYAKLHKKTWQMDESRWRIHVKDYDYMTKRGILGIMATMKECQVLKYIDLCG